jgi:nitric oxide reductase NorQ protein
MNRPAPGTTIASSRLTKEPWYLPLADEVRVFEAAYAARLPVLLKGPTGCGKTRFLEYMAWRLYRQIDSPRRGLEVPLITVACHEDLSATDLVGRYLLSGDGAQACSASSNRNRGIVSGAPAMATSLNSTA